MVRLLVTPPVKQADVVNRKLLVGMAALVLACPLFAQTAARPLVTQKVDETKLVAVAGSVSPLARARDDKGAVADSFPAGRVLLMLNRPADRGVALESFLQNAQRRGTPSYHHWITPEQFGEQFGPADSDIQAATKWLSGHGLQVARVTKGRQFIEFSGTAGQLREAFHTEIHQYVVDGKTHHANATELSIPAALAPLVRGVSPLTDFRAQPLIQVAGPARYSRSTKKTTPLFTLPNPFPSANPYAYAVAPEDFATQYDLGPLYGAGVKGSGEAIGIITSSNIDISLVAAYQQLFGLPSKPPQVVIDGGDPGPVAASETEAYLDTELSGAVAPEATVNVYIADGSSLQDPLVLAALRAIEDNEAAVLNASFGECEQGLGTAGNELWGSLWEQAAAQGQTVLVASGDSGATCNFEEIGVSGIASTPWNVAVGGTDFYYSDYATGGASTQTLWNQTNDSNLGSLKASLPEQVWNDPYGLDIIADGLAENEDYAGGGGPSSCATTDSNGNCLTAYPKPTWQAGAGVPADRVRDIPDVSLFASNGANLSTYAICAAAGECAAGADNAEEVLLVGGTSAASPAMAGIMALVNQKYGRQGQADFTLYPLATQQPSAFHDITLGSNSISYGGEVNGYAAAANYDLASGLGSVDANALVNDWNTVTAASTDTTLKLSSTSFQHGKAVTATAAVTAATGSGTPSGDVALLTNANLPANAGQGYLTLNDGTASGSISSLPGGSYNVTARYGGDGVFGSSTSSPVGVKVTPENSNITLGFVYQGRAEPATTNFQYDLPLALTVQPIGVNAAGGKPDGNATGSVTFTVDSITATVPLDSTGTGTWTLPALPPGGHTASATYSGDASFNAATATAVPFHTSQGEVSAQILVVGSSNVAPGSSVQVSLKLGPIYGDGGGSVAPVGTVAPTGTVKFCLGPIGTGQACYQTNYSQMATLSSPSGQYAQYSLALVTFPNLAAGGYQVSLEYSGDANWQAQGEIYRNYINVGTCEGTCTTVPSTTTLSITPANISGGTQTAIATTVAGMSKSGVTPTGEVDFYDNGAFFGYIYLPSATSGQSVTQSFNEVSNAFWSNGANQITAYYLGDQDYAPSTSNVVTVTVAQTVGDFSLTPGAGHVSVASGASTTVAVGLVSLNNFNSTVALNCTSSSAKVTCAASPASVMLNGTATATLTLAAPLQTTLTPQPGGRGWLGGGGLVLASFALCGLLGRRRRVGLFCVAMLAVVGVIAGCGGGSSGTKPPPPPPSDAGTYSVMVTGTSASGIVHSARITVVVPQS